MKRPDSIEDTLEQVEGFYRNYPSLRYVGDRQTHPPSVPSAQG